MSTSSVGARFCAVRRALLVLSVLLITLAIGFAGAWYTGGVEAFLIARVVRATARENLERQYMTLDGYPGRRPVEWALFAADLDAFDDARARELDEFLATATILDIQARMEAGSLSSSELTSYFLLRIRRFDSRLQSVTEPRHGGPRGTCHNIHTRT